MAQISKRANGSWMARIRRLGWPEQSKSFSTRADAEAWARHVEREMDTDSFLPSDAASRMTFAQLVELYEDKVLPKLRGKEQDTYRISRLKSEFGSLVVTRITPALLSAYRDERLKAVSAQTVVHELGLVSRLFNAAILDWKIAIPKGNPVQQMRKPAIANERNRRLEENEEQLLTEALHDRQSPWPYAAFALAIETAARMSELLALNWSEVDLKNRVARIRGKGGGLTKNDDEFRDVPLSSRAAELLRELPRSSSGRVLPITANALQIAWNRAIRQARKRHVHAVLCGKLAAHGLSEEEQAREIRAIVYKKRPPLSLTRELIAKIGQEDKFLVDLTFHDLRHEGTSRLAEKLAMHELMKVTGHKSSRMLARYYHPRAADLAKKLG